MMKKLTTILLSTALLLSATVSFANEAHYIQHNPSVADGAAAIKAAAKVWFKDASKEKIDFLRVAADRDLIFLHLKTKGDMGKDAAVVDIFA